MTTSETSPASPHPQKLLTFSSGGWVLLVAIFFTLVAAALVLYPVYATGFHPATGDGQHIETYGFDLSNLTIPRDQLIASGYPKDGIRAVPASLVETVSPPEIDLITKNEHIRFLVPSDQVVGVVIGTETRAYPVRILNLHEVVNDKLGGVPIAITWSPLCGSALVIDRRLDGEKASPLEFGVSGLLYNSDLIFFDRRSDHAKESLWSQLSLHAIAGPFAGKPLSLIPYQLTTWAEWTRDHPDTRAFLGLRTLKAHYNNAQDPFNLYLANDDLKFPVTSLWNDPHVPRKTHIVATSDDGLSWVARPAVAASVTTAPATTAALPPYRIYTFLFAWYAQHPHDTDYSAITP